MLHAEQIEQISTSSFKLFCLNDLSWIYHQSTPNTFIYAGKAAPKFDECNLHWNSRSLKEGYKLRFAIANARMFPLNPPVSCSLSSLAFQTRQLSNYNSRIFKLALGKKGLLLYARTVMGTTVTFLLWGKVIQEQVLFPMLDHQPKVSTHIIVKVWMSAVSLTHGAPWMILFRSLHQEQEWYIDTWNVLINYQRLHTNGSAELVFSLWISAVNYTLIAMIMALIQKWWCWMNWDRFLILTF